ncbi:MAG: DNA replication/repair protein RecF [Pseudomonadales bacterium]|jgi:DNA replication and repair protein RecF
MRLNRLIIQGLRNIANADVRGFSHFNLIIGPNGSGKTSFLEACHLLSTGRSFRSRQIKPVITHEATETVCFAEVVVDEARTHKIAVKKSRSDESLYRIDEVNFRSPSELARTLPVLLIEPALFVLMDGGPVVRRSFIDWGVFHVEHSFLKLWQRYQRALNQRNKLLKSGILSELELAPWEAEMSACGAAITSLREAYFEKLFEQFEVIIKRFSGWELPSISFSPGYKGDLAELLVTNRQKDGQLGYTSVGPHRADIRLRSGRFGAEKVLSRGQQKMLIIALKLAQAGVYFEAHRRKPIFLLDDLSSELDASNFLQLIPLLAELGEQIFLTGVDASLEATVSEGLKSSDIETNLAVFHVEHGSIK